MIRASEIIESGGVVGLSGGHTLDINVKGPQRWGIVYVQQPAWTDLAEGRVVEAHRIGDDMVRGPRLAAIVRPGSSSVRTRGQRLPCARPA